ncbi:restriction endonuclease [Streptomyces sp. NRRL F-5123]|uniref:restriction endonuclease n=1 Tax=Streptomyces sp. NRRL F-5123 TaxID=1463856 RepID=UPI0006931FCC|nr:restriction endonuclease [Streptomyces sp. NRRL F-5123]
MSARYRRRRWHRPTCGSFLLAVAIGAAGVWVVVRAVVAWLTGHPAAVAAVVALAALGGTGISRLTGRATARRVQRADAVREYLDLDPAAFEAAVADLCWRDGCRDVQVVGGAGDLAADVLATTPDGRTILIQCKRYAAGRSVSSPDVQRVGGTYQIVHGAQLAIVVTTGTYTADARAYARQAGIRLVDGDGLAEWARGGRPPWT